MHTSASTTAIDDAIRIIQQEIGPIVKNKTVKVDGDRATWQSGFATFSLLHSLVKPHLAKHGITLYQYPAFVPGAGERFFTRLTLGEEFVEADYPVLSSKPGPMGYGAGRSFAKRWGIMDLMGLDATDAEEKKGYQDQREPSKARQKAPAGAAQALDAIRKATSDPDFLAACSAARAAYPLEPETEKTIAGWFLHALSVAKSLDELTAIRDLGKIVKPRGGGELLEAGRVAEARLMGGK
jgi:hypothetical protein